jgi:hypothetical protein
VETLNTKDAGHGFNLVNNTRIYIITLSNRTALLPEYTQIISLVQQEWEQHISAFITFQLKKNNQKKSTSFEHKDSHIWNNLIHFLLQFICPLSGPHGDQLAGTGSRSVFPRRLPCQHHRTSPFCCCSAERARGPPTGPDRMVEVTMRAAWIRTATVTTTAVAEVCFLLRRWCCCRGAWLMFMFCCVKGRWVYRLISVLTGCTCCETNEICMSERPFHTDANEITPKLTAEDAKCLLTKQLTRAEFFVTI